MAAFLLVPCPSLHLSSPCSDFGFKLSDDLSLEVCVPDPEFAGKPYDPPVPCPVGSTYKKTRGYVLYLGGEPDLPNPGIYPTAEYKNPNSHKTHTETSAVNKLRVWT